MSDTWNAITGYDSTDYTDTMVFEVDYASKKLQKISGQTLVAGEKNSQYIRFVMPRYWDGIDISEKTINIIYQLTDDYFGTSEVIAAERSDEQLRFGWVVPETACAIEGTLLFIIVVSSEGYVLKTQITDTPVVKSLNPEEDIPEPSKETWYADFQARVEALLSETENTLNSAKGFAQSAEASAEAAAGIKEAVDETKTDLDTALGSLQELLEQIGLNKVAIAVITGRLNELVSDYDASAETEILDARVGHNGVTYGSMGEAIRGQFDELRLYVDADGYVCQSSGA